MDTTREALLDQFVASLRPNYHSQVAVLPAVFEVTAEDLRSAANTLLTDYDASKQGSMKGAVPPPEPEHVPEA